MNLTTRLLTASIIITSSLFYSCQKSTKNELTDAQLCLNTATPGTAMGCVSGISGNVEPLAYSLRCTAIFVSQGFGDAVSFVNALEKINHPGTCTGGCSSTLNAMLALSFTSGDLTDAAVRAANNTVAADAFTQCTQADAKIYTQIASLFRLGTLTSMLAYAVAPPGVPITPDQLKAQLGSPSLPPEVIGALVNVTYANTCQDPANASDSSKSYCTELGKAIADSGGSEAAIGACLLKRLNDPAATCP